MNPDMVAQLEQAGLSFTGKDETGQRMEVGFSENRIMVADTCSSCCKSCTFIVVLSFCCNFDIQIVELPTHPYFVGVQFHPEFKSRPGKPSALFLGIYKTHIYKLRINISYISPLISTLLQCV